MMDMIINNGSIKITDDNVVIVSKEIADEINKKLKDSDNGKVKPEIIIND
mgnify:CR=1 FL=1